MDTFAYLHLALTYEEPELARETTSVSGRWFLAVRKGKTFVLRGRYCLLALGTAFSLLYGSADALAVISKGDQNPQVTRVQKRLQELKFFNEKPTGYYGEITVEAVRKFQRDRGIVADGIVGQQTEAALFARPEAREENPFNSEGFLSSAQTSSRTEKASRYLDSRKIRRPLVRWSEQNPSVESSASSAIPQAPQSARQNPRSETSAIARRSPQSRQTESFLSETLEPPTFELEAAAPAGSLPSEARGTRSLEQNTSPVRGDAIASTQPISVGARGDKVIQIQKQLNDAGYAAGSVDGIYGQQTKKAVIAFQRSRGLTVDGVAGAQTLAALNSESATPSQRLDNQKIRNS